MRVCGVSDACEDTLRPVSTSLDHKHGVRDGQAHLNCHFQLALVQLLAVLTSSRSGDTSASAPTDACISGQEPGLSQIKRLDGRPVLHHNGGRGDGFWSRLDTCIPGQESGLSQKVSRRPP